MEHINRNTHTHTLLSVNLIWISPFFHHIDSALISLVTSFIVQQFFTSCTGRFPLGRVYWGCKRIQHMSFHRENGLWAVNTLVVRKVPGGADSVHRPHTFWTALIHASNDRNTDSLPHNHLWIAAELSLWAASLPLTRPAESKRDTLRRNSPTTWDHKHIPLKIRPTGI